MGSSVPAWGFLVGAAAGLILCRGSSEILPEETGALLGLEGQQTPALAPSLLTGGGETEARNSEVATYKPLLSGFLPRGVSAELSLVPHISLSQFSPPLWLQGLGAEDQSSPGCSGRTLQPRWDPESRIRCHFSAPPLGCVPLPAALLCKLAAPFRSVPYKSRLRGSAASPHSSALTSSGPGCIEVAGTGALCPLLASPVTPDATGAPR